jgi:adenylate cyclase
MALDVALHVGDVMYGNVGCDTRLDFTVIGPAVNEASRMEALCEPLGCSVVASDAFVRGLGGDAAAAFRCAGRHILRGIAEPRLLYVAAAPPA